MQPPGGHLLHLHPCRARELDQRAAAAAQASASAAATASAAAQQEQLRAELQAERTRCDARPCAATKLSFVPSSKALKLGPAGIRMTTT